MNCAQSKQSENRCADASPPTAHYIALVAHPDGFSMARALIVCPDEAEARIQATEWARRVWSVGGVCGLPPHYEGVILFASCPADPFDLGNA